LDAIGVATTSTNDIIYYFNVFVAPLLSFLLCSRQNKGSVHIMVAGARALTSPFSDAPTFIFLASYTTKQNKKNTITNIRVATRSHSSSFSWTASHQHSAWVSVITPT
jgi:hypothetical protein